MALKRAHTHTHTHTLIEVCCYFSKGFNDLLPSFFYWYLQFYLLLLPPAYRCKLFSICMHVVNRQSFVFIFVLLFSGFSHIQIKDFMWAAHTHTHLPTHFCTHLHINMSVHVCVCIYLPYYNFVLPFFAAATALLLRWQPQQSPPG